MNGRKSFITDCVKYAPAQLVPALVGLVSIPLLTRLFSPDDYGLYILVMATVSVLTTLSSWLYMAIIRFYPACERDERLEEFYASVLVALSITLLLIGGLFVFIMQILRHSFSGFYHLMLVGATLFALATTYEAFQGFFQAKREATFYALFSSWRAAAGLAFGIALATIFGFGVAGLLWGSALSMALVLPLLWKYSIGKIPRRTDLSDNLMKEMARYSFPLVVGNLAAWVLSLSDRYILEFFCSTHEVGIYSASYAISEKSILLLVSFFLLVSRPISMALWEKEGAQRARDFLSMVTRYYLLICVPAVIGLSVLAKPVMCVLTDPQYIDGYRIIPFIALSGLFLGLQQRFQEGFIYFNKTNFVMVAIIAGGAVNVGLNLLLVPKYGYMSAAVTTLIGYAVLLVIMVIASRRYLVWEFPFKSLVRAVLASIIMSIAVYSVGNSLTSSNPLNLFAAVSLGALLYLVSLVLLGEMQSNERDVLKQLVMRHLPPRFTPSDWKQGDKYA